MADKKEVRRLATDTAMFLAGRLNAVGIRTVLVDQDSSRALFEKARDGELDTDVSFSVADIQRLNYEWNGEEVSMKTFAQAFSSLIKNGDRSIEDAERIALAYIDSVRSSPADFVPKLLAENMSHARYFILRDGTVWTPEHPLANSPEYDIQRGLWEIYSRVLGEERLADFISLLDPSKLRSAEENERFVSMEREVSGSSLMQDSLEMNAERVNAERERAVKNLVQYFDGNSDYTAWEKAIVLKGAMSWGVCEKKKGDGGSEVRLVRITDSNDVCVPVVGGEVSSVVEGLRKGLNFKDALMDARERNVERCVRSVSPNFTGWKVYPRSDDEKDAVVLNQDAAGTGWCTGSGLSTARHHLSGGDFHIYFEGGEPLIAIRTEGGRLAEPPRGAHEGQFCTEREEQIAFDYISEGHGIDAGADYVADINDIRRVMSPDATWRDAFFVPDRRRYENGEFGGDTSAWGESMEKKISSLLANSVEERHSEGYFTCEEWYDSEFHRKGENDKLRFLRDGFTVRGSFFYPALQSIGKRLDVKVGAILNAPLLQSVGGGVYVYEGATLNAPVLQSVGRSLHVFEGAAFVAPVLQSLGDDLYVNDGATLDAPVLQSVSGMLNVYEGATLNAPALQCVGRSLNVYEGATLNAPVLQSVGRSLYVYEGATLDAPSLQSIKGSFEVHKGVTLDVPALQSLGDDLYVNDGATLGAPVLQSVGGSLYVREGGTLDVPALQVVGVELYLQKGATLDAPVLQSIGGNLEVREGVTLNASVLSSVGGYLNVCEGATLNVPVLQSIGWELYVRDAVTLDVPSLQRIGKSLDVREGATLDVPVLHSVGGSLYVHNGSTLNAPSLHSIGERLQVNEGAVANIPGVQGFSFSNGVVYGYSYNSTIYLTPDGIDPNTPIHEYSHLWLKALQKLNPSLWNSFKEELGKMSLSDERFQINSYGNLLSSDDRRAEEILCCLVGDNAESFLLDSSEQVLSRGVYNDDISKVVDSFRDRLLHEVLKDVFGMDSCSFSDSLTLGILSDFCNGVNPKESSIVNMDDSKISGPLDVDMQILSLMVDDLNRHMVIGRAGVSLPEGVSISDYVGDQALFGEKGGTYMRVSGREGDFVVELFSGKDVVASISSDSLSRECYERFITDSSVKMFSDENISHVRKDLERFLSSGEKIGLRDTLGVSIG